VQNFSLELRVVYVDLPDLIEIECRVLHGDWSASNTAYASPGFLRRDVAALVEWSKNPSGTFRLEGGADTGIGGLVLDFYTINTAKHACCAVKLATSARRDPRPAEVWRFAIELRTELGLIEKFGRECVSLGKDFSGVATLLGVQ
jgi:hypothetical protein